MISKLKVHRMDQLANPASPTFKMNECVNRAVSCCTPLPGLGGRAVLIGDIGSDPAPSQDFCI